MLHKSRERTEALLYTALPLAVQDPSPGFVDYENFRRIYSDATSCFLTSYPIRVDFLERNWAIKWNMLKMGNKMTVFKRCFTARQAGQGRPEPHNRSESV